MITTYKASVKEAELLTELARNIYREHYLHLWHPGGAEWYMEEYAYARGKIEMELADPNIEYFIAVENGANAGYIKLVLSVPLADNTMTTALEVERIYLHTICMGKGIGKRLMELAHERARELKRDIVLLKAMDSATPAISFYTTLGYTISGNLELPMPDFALMKKEYRGMVTLTRKVMG